MIERRPRAPVFLAIVQRCDNRQSAHQLRNQSELDQILRCHLTENIDQILLLLCDRRIKAQRCWRHALLDQFFQAIKRTAADEQDVMGIHMDKFLIRMLSDFREILSISSI